MKKSRWVLLIWGMLFISVNAAESEIQITPEEIEAQQEENAYDLNGIQQEETYLTRAVYEAWLGQTGLYPSSKSSDFERGYVSLEEVAHSLCDYIHVGGVYLPEEEKINSPYIGRLMIEGIWEEAIDLKQDKLPLSKWESLCQKAQSYLTNKKPLVIEDSTRAKVIQAYRLKLQQDLKIKPLTIGRLTKSSNILSYEDQAYNIYQFSNSHYIDLKTLEALGYSAYKAPEGYILSINSMSPQAFSDEKSKETMDIKLLGEKLYYKDIQSYILKGEENLFIPLRVLEVDYQLQLGENQILLTRKDNEEHDWLFYNQGKLYNMTEQPLYVTTQNDYWNGSEMIQKIHSQRVFPGEALEDVSKYYSLYNGIYFSTTVKSIVGETITSERTYSFGQNIEELFTHYKKAQLRLETKLQEEQKTAQDKFSKLFPDCPVIATVLNDTNGLKKGEKVELSIENNGVYTVLTSEGKKVKVAAGKLSIPQSPVAPSTSPTHEQIVAYINTKDMESSTNYLVWTDLYHQRTYVFKGENKNWSLVKSLICSTGRNATPTPRGNYVLGNKLSSFGQNKGYTCKYAVGFIGSTYLYHSVIFDVTGTYITSGKKELGQRASQGCIRFSPEDSLWFYNTLPVGTKVWIN